MSILGIITARGGSKGVPGKNLRPLGGKPLVRWTIDCAVESKIFDRLIISSDDPAIISAAVDGGAEAPFQRPSLLATDTASSADVVVHALEYLEALDGYAPERFMLLQPTSPFRGADDVRDAVALMDDALCPAVVSVCEDTHSPFFSLRIAENGALERLFMDAPVATRRQDLPSTYHINGAIYLSRTEVFLRTRSFLPEGTQPLVMPAERSIDIDTAFDFALCEALLSIQSDQFIRRDRPSPGL